MYWSSQGSPSPNIRITNRVARQHDGDEQLNVQGWVEPKFKTQDRVVGFVAADAVTEDAVQRRKD